MKNLTVKPFKTVEAAGYFVQEELGYLPTNCEYHLRTKGYYQAGKYLVVIDPNGEIIETVKRSILKVWRKCFKSLEMWFKVWRAKK